MDLPFIPKVSLKLSINLQNKLGNSLINQKQSLNMINLHQKSLKLNLTKDERKKNKNDIKIITKRKEKDRIRHLLNKNIQYRLPGIVKKMIYFRNKKLKNNAFIKIENSGFSNTFVKPKVSEDKEMNSNKIIHTETYSKLCGFSKNNEINRTNIKINNNSILKFVSQDIFPKKMKDFILQTDFSQRNENNQKLLNSEKKLINLRRIIDNYNNLKDDRFKISDRIVTDFSKNIFNHNCCLSLEKNNYHNNKLNFFSQQNSFINEIESKYKSIFRIKKINNQLEEKSEKTEKYNNIFSVYHENIDNGNNINIKENKNILENFKEKSIVTNISDEEKKGTINEMNNTISEDKTKINIGNIIDSNINKIPKNCYDIEIDSLEKNKIRDSSKINYIFNNKKSKYSQTEKLCDKRQKSKYRTIKINLFQKSLNFLEHNDNGEIDTIKPKSIFIKNE